MAIHPAYQQDGLGTGFARRIAAETHTQRLIGYTRNPAILKLLAEVSGRHDILDHANPVTVADELPNATLAADGNIYHIGRYAPNGLYVAYDPASRDYLGQPLRERCALLNDPNNALVLSVNLQEEL